MDPNWNKAFDIVPGTVMARLTGEVFTPFYSSNPSLTDGANAKPYGLSALWMAPTLGIDEVSPSGSNVFTVWVGGEQAVFEVLAPGFDVSAPWQMTNVTGGGYQLLTSNSQGLLTPVGATNANAIAELVDVEDVNKILIRLNRYAFTSAVATSGS